MLGPKADDEVANGHANGGLNGSTDSANSSGKWDWKLVEAENERGMEFSRHFAALDGLDDAFSGDERPALGSYYDL